MRIKTCLGICLLMISSACGGGGSVDAGTTDSSLADASDGATDAATDSAADASTDAATDAATDASADAATDAATDASTDAATDAATDASTDAATDATAASGFGTPGCTTNADCSTGLCWDFSDYDSLCGGKICSDTCTSDAECQDKASAAGSTNPAGARCVGDGTCDLVGAGLGAFFCA